MIDCPVLNYKVVNCFGCRFWKKWAGRDSEPSCKFEEVKKYTKVEAKAGK